MKILKTVRSCLCVAVLLSVVEGSCRNCIKCGDSGESSGGCKPGFAGLTCDYECSSHCVDSLCFLDANTGTLPCSIGCTTGYYGLHCNAQCISTDDEGVCDRFSGTTPDCNGTNYGNSCEESCEARCDGSMCDNKGKCFEEVCIPGRHGAGCSDVCGSNCERCHKDRGGCIKYIDNDLPDKSTCSCDNSGHAQVNCDNGYFIVIIVLIVSFGIINLFFLGKGHCHKGNTCDRYKYQTVATGEDKGTDNNTRTPLQQIELDRQEGGLKTLYG